VLGQSGHDGSILAAQSYTAFGRVLNQSGATNNPMKYTGREQDGATGFYYYRARYYDPVIGRFISEDPKGFGAGDVNFYAYVGNNPVNANDPTGYAPITEILTNIASKYGIGDCKECANALMKAATEAGYSGNLLEMRANIVGGKGNYIWNDAINKNISDNADHAAVEINGLVYDNFNNGIPRTEWQAQFHSLYDFEVKPTPFSPSTGSITLNEVGSMLITGAAIGLKVVDVASQILDPVGTYVIGKEAGAGSDIGGTISWSSNNFWSSSSANGGFVLYPNKSNNNMMRSVYSK